ncbi:MAG: hypothetical protein AAFZ91_00655 [Pseudomonadota bacterium]
MSQISKDADKVDLFLDTAEKKLADFHPEWTFVAGYNQWRMDLPIELPSGAQLATLKYSASDRNRSRFSSQLFWRNRPVFRLDIEETDGPTVREHDQPIWVEKLGLPSLIVGPHIHTWQHNRDQICHTSNWELIARVPFEHKMNTVQQMHKWSLNYLKLEAEQDKWDIPGLPSGGLF